MATIKEIIEFEKDSSKQETVDEFRYKDIRNKDMVNHPPHYNQYGIECIDAIQAATGDGYEYYLQGNILKYLWRYRYKNGIEDLRKAQWYLNKLIEVYYADQCILDFTSRRR